MSVLLTSGQSVALWEEGIRNSLCLFTVQCNGTSPSVLGGVSKCLLRAMKWALLAVGGSLSWREFSELPLVTPLAFSDLAHDLLEGTLLMGRGSGVEVPLI